MRFAGYKKPHPLEEKIEIKVQTNGEVTPPDAILQSCAALNGTLEKLIGSFKDEIDKYKGTDIAAYANDGANPPHLAGTEDQTMQMPF